MRIAKITGSVTATAKDPQLTGSKMLIENTTNANGKDATGYNSSHFVTVTFQKQKWISS